MIDKELIRQAAEDIDLFGDDLSAEFDRLSQAETRTFRLWPYVAAACIALLLVVGMSVRLLTSSTPNDTGSLASGQVKTTKDTASVHGRNLAQTDATTEEQLIEASTLAYGAKVEQPQTDTMPNVPPTSVKTSHTVAPAHQTLAMTPVDSQMADGMAQEEDGYSEELLYALITEVEAKARAEEEAKEDRLYRTLIEEISTNISKETTQMELTL